DRPFSTFGDVRGQAYWRSTRLPGSGDQAGGLRLYWGDAGGTYSQDEGSARVTLNYNDGTRQLKLHQLWGQYTADNGWYARAGSVILTFADSKGEFPTFSAARQLGFTSANAVGIGWNRPDWGASAWLYDSGSSAMTSGSVNLNEFAVSLKLL